MMTLLFKFQEVCKHAQNNLVRKKENFKHIYYYIIYVWSFFMKKYEMKINFYSGEEDLNTILQRIIRIKLKKQFMVSINEKTSKTKSRAVKKL